MSTAATIQTSGVEDRPRDWKIRWKRRKFEAVMLPVLDRFQMTASDLWTSCGKWSSAYEGWIFSSRGELYDSLNRLTNNGTIVKIIYGRKQVSYATRNRFMLDFGRQPPPNFVFKVDRTGWEKWNKTDRAWQRTIKREERHGGPFYYPPFHTKRKVSK
jgi:hypothetical protein